MNWIVFAGGYLCGMVAVLFGIWINRDSLVAKSYKRLTDRGWHIVRFDHNQIDDATHVTEEWTP